MSSDGSNGHNGTHYHFGRGYAQIAGVDHKVHEPDGLHDREQEHPPKPCCARIDRDGRVTWCVLDEHGPEIEHTPVPTKP
jgi:hypothetical protein